MNSQISQITFDTLFLKKKNSTEKTTIAAPNASNEYKKTLKKLYNSNIKASPKTLLISILSWLEEYSINGFITNKKRFKPIDPSLILQEWRICDFNKILKFANKTLYSFDKNELSLTPTHIGFCYCLFLRDSQHKATQEDIEYFFITLIHKDQGRYKDKDIAIKLLRDILVENKKLSSYRRLTNVLLCHMIILAWNFWIQEKINLTRIDLKPSKKFPQTF